MTMQQIGLLRPRYYEYGAKFCIQVTPDMSVEEFVKVVRDGLLEELDSWSKTDAANLLERLKDKPASPRDTHGVYLLSVPNSGERA